MKMKLKNNLIYNLTKNIYYRYAYFRYPHKWNKKSNYVSVYFNDEEYKFKLFEEKREKYTKPYFMSEDIPFFWIELPGYLKLKGIKKGDYVVDMGAFHGSFSIYADKKVGSEGKILAFEPEKGNMNILKENLKLNSCKNVLPIEKGNWNKEENLFFEGTGLGAHIGKKGKTKITVTDLDSELQRLKIPITKIKFIKMDIEGAEIEAIEGMKNLLKRGSPNLSIATYHWRNGKQTYYEVEEKLKKWGYKVKTGYSKHLTTWAWKE